QLLGDEGGHDAGGVGVRLLEEVDAVEPHLGGLLHDRPRELLDLVVVRGDWSDLFFSERVNPVPDLALLVGQLKRNHPRLLSAAPVGAPGQSTHWYARVPFFLRVKLRRSASLCQLVRSEELARPLPASPRAGRRRAR